MSDFAEFTSFANRYAQARCSQNPESVAAFFAANGSLRVNDGPPAIGRAAIAEVARGLIDMPAFYERQRPVLFSAFAAMYAMSMVANFADRNNLEGWKPGDWIGAELLVLPMLIAALVAGWAKPRWLQWTAGCLRSRSNPGFSSLATLWRPRFVLLTLLTHESQRPRQPWTDRRRDWCHGYTCLSGGSDPRQH